MTPGVYTFRPVAAFELTGTLTLDGQERPRSRLRISRLGSTLTTASGSSVNLINGARYCRTFWQVGSSATLGTNSDFVGHIFALTSITANYRCDSARTVAGTEWRGHARQQYHHKRVLCGPTAPRLSHAACN